ncbi:MAG: acyl-CoA dehydrogenase family protein, partial [Hyphomonadaceae bacterium]
MDLSYTAEYLAYQGEVRAFLAERWDLAKARDKDYVAAFRKAATERGYINRWIPRAYGGSEQPADVVAAQIIREEFASARAPREVPGIGMMMLVPTLLEVGEDWQKERFVEKTVIGEYRWAQGYSEPGAGSDLASLRTRAELRDGEWVINGQKIWTTMAYDATHMFCLCRTEPEASKHDGISYILLDFKQPGVTVRPLKQISGSSEFCEVFFDDVRTPADWIVGRRGEGWRVSRVNLKHERNAVGGPANSLELFEKVKRLAQTTFIDGERAIDRPLIRERLAVIEGYVLTHLYSGYYQQTLAVNDEPAGVLGLINKITTTNIGQQIANVAADIIGETGLLAPSHDPKARPGDEKWVNQMMGSLGLSIAGGASN